ncbi:hypothetical protein [Heliorestis convoluta]|uniref:Uncharacterized protein n=1 Tax=Heliorestis convoluta TaxID=356322 RepID=A0A5Q2N457_9FIRM|nr:hypothetical protein [Heliorestis convoluta]QGG47050.1 hypothetical protein FTV88_0894 [Heliorestis convoluta]
MTQLRKDLLLLLMEVAAEMRWEKEDKAAKEKKEQLLQAKHQQAKVDHYKTEQEKLDESGPPIPTGKIEEPPSHLEQSTP